MHNISFEEYKVKYPEADMGAPNLQAKKPYVKNDNRLFGKKKKINIRDENGDPVSNFEMSAPIYLRLRKFKSDYGITYTAAIDKLLEIFYKLKDHPIVQETMGSEHLNEVDELPENFVPQHREILQQLLVKYELMVQDAVKDGNIKEVSAHLERLAKINTILPELEKSYQSNADTKIRKIVEDRKMICRNYLPRIVESLNG